MLTSAELELYSRQLLINGWGKESQEKIKNTHLFFAGAGGLASSAASYCAAAGFGKMTICDYDSISLSNLNRQILHTHARIGMQKADSAYVSLTQSNPFVQISIQNTKITSKNISALIEQTDIVLDCLDNFVTRQILSKACVKLKKPLIHAGVQGFNGQLTVVLPYKTPCLACFLPKKNVKQTIPVVGITPGIFGTLQACEAVKLATGLGTVTANELLIFEGLSMRLTKIALDRNPACAICTP